MLWRALRDVEQGFYVDLGAQDPLVDSVSLAFHERGWLWVSIRSTAWDSRLMKDAVTIVVVHVTRQHDQSLLNIGQDLGLKAGADFL